MCFWLSIIFLLILIVATPPIYPYSRLWGYYPAGAALALLVLLLLFGGWRGCRRGITWYYPVAP